MILFYAPDTDGSWVDLPPDEARHCVQVLRHTTGDIIHWVDGRGNFYSGPIIEAGKKRCRVQIEERRQSRTDRSYRVHLAVAPTKHIDRFEWFLEKATEIGVDRITPMLCRHSERRQIRQDRLEKILVAAMKQSLQAYLPELRTLTTLPDLLPQLAENTQGFVAYLDESENSHLKDNCRPGRDVCILIGPEGGFHPDEIELARSSGFKTCSLGPNRLRTETAALVACHIANLVNQ